MLNFLIETSQTNTEASPGVHNTAGVKSGALRMKQKPLVCLIDQDPVVKEGWLISLKDDAELHYFKDHLGLFKKASVSHNLLETYSCVIMCRHFSHLDLDIVNSPIPDTLRSSGAGPLFLNYQGFITKEELNQKFDGKLFHRYGVRWQTLRLRIQKFEKKHRLRKPGTGNWAVRSRSVRSQVPSMVSRPERCSALLRSMARKASGTHREKIEFYADQDPSNGIRLLEAIYIRLVTDKNRPDGCPSRYINSSPVIAKRILHDTLYSH